MRISRYFFITFLLVLLPITLTSISGCLRCSGHCPYYPPQGKEDAVCLPQQGRDTLQGRDILFQVSTIDALFEGIYDGDITCADLKVHGDFGIGTFNGLDGEMIELGGNFYQVRSDGVAYRADDSTKVHFAEVTFFDPDKTAVLDKTTCSGMDYKRLEHYLDTLLPTENIFYAVKITGDYDYIKTRSVPRQNRPYLPLVEVVKNQPTFEFHQVKGTIAGFRCPEYVKGINVPSYHFHFITEDGKAGGHLLECRLHNVRVEIDYTCGFHMALPEGGEFYQAHLAKEKQSELNKVEKQGALWPGNRQTENINGEHKEE